MQDQAAPQERQPCCQCWGGDSLPMLLLLASFNFNMQYQKKNVTQASFLNLRLFFKKNLWRLTYFSFFPSSIYFIISLLPFLEPSDSIWSIKMTVYFPLELLLCHIMQNVPRFIIFLLRDHKKEGLVIYHADPCSQVC